MTPPQKCCVAKWKAALLGGFVCWQLFYLVTTNALQFVPLRVPADPGDAPLNLQSVGRFTSDDRLQTLADTAGTGLARYSEVSGQIQFWKLFTPEFPSHTITLEARTGRQGCVTMSVVKTGPADPHTTPVRFPRRDVRPFQFEASVGLGAWPVTDGDVVKHPDETWEQLRDWAVVRERAALTFLRTTFPQCAGNEHSAPVGELILVTHFTPTPRHGESWPESPITHERPFLRFLDPFGPDPKLEVFDPARNKFRPVQEDVK
jgi:hypothetical protein